MDMLVYVYISLSPYIDETQIKIINSHLQFMN